MNVAFLGLGIMGSRMAANLVRAGHDLRVWTRTPGKADAWVRELGSTPISCSTAEEACEGVEATISMVVDADQVRALCDEVGDERGGLWIDMSTIGVAPAEELAARRRFVDAPVTGSSPKAEDGTLTIMAGGPGAEVELARPLFEAMGSLVVHVGERAGQGQALKLVNNAVAAANTATLAQALLVADALGVSLDAFEQVLGAGSGGSAMLALKTGPMREHDWTTLFKAEHMLKDVRLALDEAQRAGVPFPAAGAARDALVAACGIGHTDDDFAALLVAYEGMSGRKLGA